MRGQFITLEGIEGAGKSTALRFIQTYLTKHLKSFNQSLVVTREPGGTAFAETLRDLLLHPNNENETILPETELLIFFAGRAQHIAHCILPALQSGAWVLSDRYIDATYAYQGGGRQINIHQINLLDRWIVGNLYPDLTLLLDLPVTLGLDRAKTRNMAKDRIEQEENDFFTRVRECYLQRAKQDPERVKVIDASQGLSSVQTQIVSILESFSQGK